MGIYQVVGVGLLLLGVGLSGILIWGAVRTLQTASRIENTPISDIGRIEPGLRKVRGKVVPLGPLVLSPVAGTPCVYFEMTGVYTILARRKFGFYQNPADFRDTMIPIRDSKTSAWAIGDDAATIRVEPTDCELTLGLPCHKKKWNSHEIPDHILDVSDRFVPDVLRDDKAVVDCSEKCIVPGTELMVVGDVVQTASGPAFASVAHPLLITDDSDPIASSKHRRWALLQLGIAALFFFVFGYIGTSNLKPKADAPQPAPGKIGVQKK